MHIKSQHNRIEYIGLESKCRDKVAHTIIQRGKEVQSDGPDGSSYHCNEFR